MAAAPGRSRPLGGRLLRVLADALVITVSFLIGIAVDYAIRSVRDPIGTDLVAYVGTYLPALWPLLVISLAYFALGGFYSRQRTYRGLHKAQAILQSSLLAFLTYGAMAYALRAYLPFPPAVAIVATAVCATALLLVMHLYALLWARMARIQVSTAAQDGGNRASVHRAQVTERPEVLVIGGAGYIGSALVPLLLDQGLTVRLLDRFLFGHAAIAPFADHPRLVIHDADYRRTDQVLIAMRHADTVIHLGGIVGDPACALDEGLTIELNVAANQAVAEIARAQRVRRFVFASSCSVYGANNEILNEHSQLNPVSLYARSKVASEIVLQKLADSHFAPTILRLGTVHGLSGRTRFDLVVNLLTAKAATEGIIPIVGPEQWRPFVHVSDAAAAFALAATTTSAIVMNRTFNVGGNEQNMTLGQLAQLIAAKVPGARIVEESSPEDPRNYRVNFDRIDRELGFRTTWTVEQGVDQVLEALRSGRIDDYTKPEYSNVAWFTELLSRGVVAPDHRMMKQSLGSQIGFAEDTGAMRDAGSA